MGSSGPDTEWRLATILEPALQMDLTTATERLNRFPRWQRFFGYDIVR